METDKVIKFKPKLLIRKFTNQEEVQDSPSKICKKKKKKKKIIFIDNIFSTCNKQQSDSGSKSSASDKDLTESQLNSPSQINQAKQFLANQKIIQRRKSIRRYKNPELQNAINNGSVLEINYNYIIQDIQNIQSRINSCERKEISKKSLMPTFIRLQQERQQKQLENMDKYESIWESTEHQISQKLQRKPNQTLMQLSAIQHRQKVEKEKVIHQLLQKQSATTTQQYFASTLRQIKKKQDTPLPQAPHIADRNEKKILESSFISSQNVAKENKKIQKTQPKLIYIERQGKPNFLGDESKKMHAKLVKFIDNTIQSDQQYANFAVKYYDPDFQDLQVKGQSVLQRESKVYYNLSNIERTSSFYKFLNIKENESQKKEEQISEYFTKKQLDSEYIVAFEKKKKNS